MEIAERLEYLNLPYAGEDWGLAKATDPKEFIFITSIFYGALSLDIDDALRQEWRRNLGDDVPFETAFVETCLVAWELR
jgi:hypothetical protein